MAKKPRTRKYWKTVFDIQLLILKIPHIISGRITPKGTAERRLYNSFWSAVTKRLFEELHHAYLQKSNYEADDNGNTWIGLTPKYKAYSRRQDRAKELTPNQRRRLHNPDTPGLLTPTQHKKWQKVFAKVYQREVKKMRGLASPSPGKYLTRGKYKKFLKQNRGNKIVPDPNMTDADAKKKAASIAWAAIKAQGAETLIGELGWKPLDIMIRTGTLIKSLRPGRVNGALRYVKGDKYQVARLGAGFVFIGTSVPYAAFASRNITTKSGHTYKREFIPTSEDMGVFLDRALDAGTEAFTKELKDLIESNKHLQ